LENRVWLFFAVQAFYLSAGERKIHRRPHARDLLLNGTLVVGEKQLAHGEFVQMQIRANYFVGIDHGAYNALGSVFVVSYARSNEWVSELFHCRAAFRSKFGSELLLLALGHRTFAAAESPDFTLLAVKNSGIDPAAHTKTQYRVEPGQDKKNSQAANHPSDMTI